MSTAPTLPPFKPNREPLPWATRWDRLLGRRCAARLTLGETGGADRGRCQLVWHPPALGHALRRAQWDVRWRAKTWAS